MGPKRLPSFDYPTPCKQMNYWVALLLLYLVLGLMLLMNHTHVPLLFISVGFIMIHDKIILFNWNMERPHETTVQP
jgi:L-asparagine transporter-like permease